MALSTAQIVRGRLNDTWRRGSEVIHGDGTASGFKLQQGAPYSVLISATASVVTNNGWSATGATFDTAQGYVTLSDVPSALSAVRVDYQWAVFGDEEISYFTGQGGIPQAIIAGIDWLMGDAWKRARWRAPDGSEYDDKQAMKNLKDWREQLRKSITEDVGPEGGLESWSVQQGNY